KRPAKPPVDNAVVDSGPVSTPIRPRTSAESIPALIRDADSIRAARFYAEAQTAYIRILEMQPTGPNLARAYQGLGLSLDARGRHDEAFRALNRAVDLDPTLTEAQFSLARLYSVVGFQDEATRRMELVVKQKPDNAQYQHALGMCYAEDP